MTDFNSKISLILVDHHSASSTQTWKSTNKGVLELEAASEKGSVLKSFFFIYLYAQCHLQAGAISLVLEPLFHYFEYSPHPQR